MNRTNTQTLIVAFSLLFLGVDIFLNRGYYNTYYMHYFDYTEAHRYIGVVIIVVGGWFLGRAND